MLINKETILYNEVYTMYLSTISSRLLLCDVSSWDFKKSYGNYDGLLRDISWSDDGKYMLQVNPKGLIEILNVTEHDVQSLQHIPLKETWSATFHRDGHRNVAIGTKNGNVLIWDTKNKTITKTFPTPSHQCNVNFLSYNSKNTNLAATMQNGDTVIYGLVSNNPVLTIKLPCSKSISSMKFHHDSRSLLGFATDEGHIVVRDITTNKDKAYFENIHASPVSDIAYSLINRDVFLSSGYDKIVNVYDLRMHNVVSTIQTSYTLTSLALNIDNQVALGSKNGLVLIYDLRDFSSPFKVMKGHKDEVCKLAFQPARKRISADISLRENTEMNLSPQKVHSPIRNKTSDMFYIVDTPPKNNPTRVSPQSGDTKADSFLALMGLDITDNEEGDYTKTTDAAERKTDKYEQRYQRMEADRNVTKSSTPLNSRLVENLVIPSPLLGTDGLALDNSTSNHNVLDVNVSSDKTHDVKLEKTAEEMKDFIKLLLVDVSDANRNYFLNIMMQLTKQKLFLEKQYSEMNVQVQSLVQNQNTIIDMVRKLSLDIEKLKCQKKQ